MSAQVYNLVYLFINQIVPDFNYNFDRIFDYTVFDFDYIFFHKFA